MKMKNWKKWTNKIFKIWKKNLNANVLQIFAYCEQIVSDKVEANLNEVGKLLTMWAEFRSQCGEQI